MRFLIGLLSFLILPLPTQAAEMKSQKTPIVRVSVLASVKVFLNGKESNLVAIKAAFEKTKAENGSVWYYRENAKGEPPPQGMEVIKLIVENKLPISMSSKADFSDYIDENGQSRPRK